MKKVIISLLLLSTVLANTFAQDYNVVYGDEIEDGEEYFDTADEADNEEEIVFKHNEVYLTVGEPSCFSIGSNLFAAIFDGFLDLFGDSENSGNSSESSKFLPELTFTGGYNYYFTENFGLGGFASYENILGLSFVSIQIKFTAQYGWEHFKFYHALSGGIVIISAGELSNTLGIFDITYLGAKADFETFSIFAECCFPFTALIKVGASIKF